MNPRIRPLVIGDRIVLVLDQVGPIPRDQADQWTSDIQRAAARVGLDGALIFAESIDLPDDVSRAEMQASESRKHIFVDQKFIEALRWAVATLDMAPNDQAQPHSGSDDGSAQAIAELRHTLRRLQS